MWRWIEHLLLRRGVNTYLELALWILLVYILIGVVYAAFHIELMAELEAAFAGTFTIFADLAALAVTIAGWPLLWITSLLCDTAGCGVF